MYKLKETTEPILKIHISKAALSASNIKKKKNKLEIPTKIVITEPTVSKICL